MLDEIACRIRCGVCLFCGDEVCLLRESVDENEDSVVAVGGGSDWISSVEIDRQGADGIGRGSSRP